MSYPTGTCKLCMCNESPLTVGSVYDLKGICVQHDSFGQTELVSPKQGLQIVKSSTNMETAKIDPAMDGIPGEIVSIQYIGKYRECGNCRKNFLRQQRRS